MPTHLDAFGRQQRARFVDEMVVHLRAEYADVVAGRDDAWVRELIDVGIDQAREYGIVLERDVARYLELMLALSPNFDDSSKTPWCKDILTDGELTAEVKLDQIYESIIFGQENEQAGRDSEHGAPPPFRHVVVRRADEVFRGMYPEVDRRRLTMEWQDEWYRTAWMAEYHRALDDLGIPPPTARPDVEVGAAVTGHSERATGDLTVVLVETKSQRALVGASVRVTGPGTHFAVTDSLGEAHLEGLATGEYRIVGMDAQHNVGSENCSVKRGQTQVRLTCRHATSLSEML